VKLGLPAGVFGAYLFDCDGTVADSMPLHYIAWTKSLAEWNCTFDEKLFYAWGGRPVAEIISLLNEQQRLSMQVGRGFPERRLVSRIAAAAQGCAGSAGAY